MPLGTGQEHLSTIPQQGIVTDPALFMQSTKKRVYNPIGFTAPDPGQSEVFDLPRAGIASKLQVTFVGQVVVTPGTGSVTSSNEWPYNVMRAFSLNVNGHSELWNCSGLDLAALRYVRYPAYSDVVDEFPGQVGGGDVLEAGTHDLHLTWEIPLAMDDVSLIGSLYLQSASSNVQSRISQALNSDLFILAGNGAVALTGRYTTELTTFEVPYDGERNIIVPDLSRLHGFTAQRVPFTATGENRVELIRSSGQLARLFVSAEKADNARLSAHPTTPAASASRASASSTAPASGRSCSTPRPRCWRSTTSTTAGSPPTTGSCSTRSARTPSATRSRCRASPSWPPCSRPTRRSCPRRAASASSPRRCSRPEERS